MMNICPVCGKLTCIHWPEHWVYRRGSTYYCGEQCLTVDLVRDTKLMNEVKKRRMREKKMISKITPDMRKKAAEIAISGGSPLEYLKKCGSKNPSASWQYIRQTLEKNDPETFAKLPGRLPKTAGDAMIAMKDAADEFFSQCEDMGLKTITDEDSEAIIPEVDLTIKSEDLFTEEEREFEKRTTVTAIRVEGLGEFYFDKKFKAIDWRTEGGDEVSLGPAWWLQLAEDLPLILTKLGVES